MVEKSATVGEPVTIDGGQEGAASYQWVQTAGPVVQLDTPHNAQLLFTPAEDGEYAFTLTVANTDGSTRTIVVQVSVKSSPAALKADAGADQVVLPGHSLVLAGTATGGTPPYQYAWTPADGLDDPMVAQPTATPSASTVYTLTVTDSAGASATDSVRVAVGTAVSGPYWTNTTWTVEESPYVLVGDVQIPEGIVLTIQPGVEVVYTGATKVYVKGAVVANGAPNQLITFRGSASSAVSPATFIEFDRADLSDTQLSYVAMKGAVRAVNLVWTSDQPELENTGTLTLNHADLEATAIALHGAEPWNSSSTARITLTDCVLTKVAIGPEDYTCADQPVDFAGCALVNSTIKATSARGSTISGCTVAGTRILSACHSVLTLSDTVLENCALQTRDSAPDGNYVVNVQRCQSRNVGVYLYRAAVSIVDSSFLYDATFSPNYDLPSVYTSPASGVTLGGATVQYSTFAGDGTGIGMAVEASSYMGAFAMDHCTVQGFETPVLVTVHGCASRCSNPLADNGCAITDSNLLAYGRYALDNRRTTDVNCTNSYWDTADSAQIAIKISDYFDDITLGKVTFAPFATAAIPDAGPRP